MKAQRRSRRPQSDDPNLSWCSSCKAFKPVAEFVKNKNTKSGLAYWCRACLGPYTRAYGSTRAAYFHRRKRYGSNLLEVPIGAKPGELKAAAEARKRRVA